MEVITITIDEKKPYVGEAERHPFGDFYENSVKYTCWDEDLFKDFNVGDRVEIAFTTKSNEYNGRTFTNRNISTIKISPQVVQGREVEVIKIDDSNRESDITETVEKLYDNGNSSPSSVSHVYTIGDLQYEVTVRLV